MASTARRQVQDKRNFSGEFFPSRIPEIISVLSARAQDQKIAIVCGGGNILRGGRGIAKEMSRNIADQIGMIGTVINGEDRRTTRRGGQEKDKKRTRAGQEEDKRRTRGGQEKDKRRRREGQKAARG